MLTKETILRIHNRLDKSKMVNESALDFALSSQRETKDWLQQLSYVIRAILIDHVFADGNKRVTLALTIGVLEDLKFGYNAQKLENNIVKILKENITNIRKIKKLIKDVIR